VALLVGTCLTILNQGDVIAGVIADGATPRLALLWKIPADVRRALPRLHVLERRRREVVTRLTPESGLSCARSFKRHNRSASHGSTTSSLAR
jgi:hypothetical protein